MLRELRLISLKKNLFISIVGVGMGGLGLAALIHDWRKNGAGFSQNMSMYIASFVFLAAGLFLIILPLSGGSQKTLQKYCAQSGNLAKVEQFYRSTPPVYGVRISREYVLAAGAKTHFLLTSDLLWVYMNVSVLPPYFKREIYIHFMPKDGKAEQYKVKNEKQANAILEYVQKTLPWIFVGSSKQLEKIYQSDRQSMIRAVEERKAKDKSVMYL